MAKQQASHSPWLCFFKTLITTPGENGNLCVYWYFQASPICSVPIGSFLFPHELLLPTSLLLSLTGELLWPDSCRPDPCLSRATPYGKCLWCGLGCQGESQASWSPSAEWDLALVTSSAGPCVMLKVACSIWFGAKKLEFIHNSFEQKVPFWQPFPHPPLIKVNLEYMWKQTNSEKS